VPLQAERPGLRFVILLSPFGSTIHHQIHSSQCAVGDWPFAANSRAFSPSANQREQKNDQKMKSALFDLTEGADENSEESEEI
jgi:hypothetical protein